MDHGKHHLRVSRIQSNNDVKVAEYRPTADDVGNFLRVTVSYRDTRNSNTLYPEKTSDPTVSANKVAKSLENVAPYFVYTADDEIPAGSDDEVGDEIPTPDNADRPTVVREIAENTAADKDIGEPIKAKDGNGDTLTYEFDTTQTDHTSFAINSGTGQISVGASATLDRESKDTYAVRVIAKDPSDSRATIDVTIKLTNVEEKPSIISGPTDITQTEITYNPDNNRESATTTRDEKVAVSAFVSETIDGQVPRDWDKGGHL